LIGINQFEENLLSMSDKRLFLQSEPVIDATSGTTSEHTNQETVEFIDETSTLDTGYSEMGNSIVSRDTIAVADLATFLKRPVRIGQYYWQESDPPDSILYQINPWFLFFNDTRIKFKLNNFAFIRCNLHIKVVINASPFYYGCMGMSYQPLQVLTPSLIRSSVAAHQLIPRSQRPISYIYPQMSQGAEMTLPFFLHKNWLDINTAQDFQNMGQLSFNAFAALRSANGVSSNGVSMLVYAWAEDVELSGSTLSLSLQSKPMDEYGQGPVSRPASIIAKLAGLAKNVPVIGKFATATEIGAKAISGIATLFGFTNVPVIDNVMPYQPRAFPALGSTQISFPNEKLTLDPKNELSVDASIVGAPSEDPLAIQNFCTKESYIVRSTWDTAHAVDTILFYSRVHPFMFNMSTNSPGATIDMTPMALTSTLFEGWRGDIIFRFKVIASPYHKGRLIIAFDPQGDATNNVVNQALVSSAIYTKIIDLGEDDDVELRVPYNQAFSYLKTETSFSTSSVPFSVSTTPTWNPTEGIDNGALTVKVLTQLTAPVLTAPVNVLVYVRAAENIEFGNPRRPGTSATVFQLQSQPISEEGQDHKVFGAPGDSIQTLQNRVNYGECVRSLRVLLRRSNLIYTQTTNVTGQLSSRWTSTFGKIPLYYGYDPNGIHTATQTIGIFTSPFNFVKNTPIAVILPCFVGYRGSGVWTFNTNSLNPSKSIRVTREPVINMVWSDSSTVFTPGTPSINARDDLVTTLNTTGGCALTNQFTQAGLSVLCPNYNYYNFNSTAPGNASLAPTGSFTQDGSADDTFRLEAFINTSSENTRTYIEKYWHAGPDFQPIFFLNVPTQYYLPTVPTGV
jgi:hypothetical protein